MPESSYLFVYGTLRRAAGTSWGQLLAARSTLVSGGRTHGALFQLDGFPGMITCSDPDAWVHGEVCLLEDPPSTLRMLDAYEGCGPGDPFPHEFSRSVVTVVLDSGEAAEAWAYLYALETHGKTRIASGDYLAGGR